MNTTRRPGPPSTPPDSLPPVSAEVALLGGASLTLALRLAGGGSDRDVAFGGGL